MRELYATLGAYLGGRMHAGRLRPTHPLVAVQSLMGPLLLYALIRPDFWQDALGEQPSPQQSAAELVQIWLCGVQPETPPPVG